jgi:hypothetical protein
MQTKPSSHGRVDSRMPSKLQSAGEMQQTAGFFRVQPAITTNARINTNARTA